MHAASRITVLLSGLLSVPDALAHHSFAPHFDSGKPVNISGTVTEYEGRNPHSYLHIAAMDENGSSHATGSVRTFSRWAPRYE